MKRILYLFIALLLCGCHDSYWDLGDSYLYENGRINKYIDEKKGSMSILIPEDVLNFAFDEDHIIAYQIPDSVIYREFYIDIYKDFSDPTIRSQKTTDSLEILLDSMLSIKHCYWIIQKKDCKVYGPMTESDFNRKCKKTKITLKWVRDTSPDNL